jgi:hypothetical protein
MLSLAALWAGQDEDSELAVQLWCKGLRCRVCGTCPEPAAPQRHTYCSAEPCWERASDLGGSTASAALRMFMRGWRRLRRLPEPGSVGLVAGGPPCQNVSGLNRHAKLEDVMHDPKNRCGLRGAAQGGGAWHKA